MVQSKKNVLPVLENVKKIIIKHKIAVIVVLAVLIVPHVVHFAAVHAGKSRRVMYFQQVGSEKIEKEVRYIPKNESQSEIESYISELLLGPEIHRVRPLFSLSTSLEFCILKDKTLYVGLSEDAVFQDNEATDFYRGEELLKKNIKKNFPEISDIEIFAGDIFIEDKAQNAN